LEKEGPTGAGLKGPQNIFSKETACQPFEVHGGGRQIGLNTDIVESSANGSS
jgi:hypothetical protein